MIEGVDQWEVEIEQRIGRTVRSRYFPKQTAVLKAEPQYLGSCDRYKGILIH